MWDFFATVSQIFQVQSDRFFDQLSNTRFALGHRYAARQVRHISAVRALLFLNDHQIFHYSPRFRPACLRTLLIVPLGMSSDHVPRDRYCTGFCPMMKLPVTSFLSNLKPTVPFDYFDQLSHLHCIPTVAAVKTSTFPYYTLHRDNRVIAFGVGCHLPLFVAESFDGVES